jgi:Tol biopolymer transport system component
MLTAGTRLGPYAIAASLGAGGMGEVYRARDTRLDRDVALKLLPESFALDADRLMRFEREAKTLAALNHASIAQIYHVEEISRTDGEGSGVRRVLVMELVEGEDLSERIALGAMPAEEALPVARQIADALAAAHDAGIIHRDLKPANIKLRTDGSVKVLDFGLAKQSVGPLAHGSSPGVSAALTSPAMTMQGVILGTAAYMSPEQAKGRPVDKRADIWAFGCVLYEMLTGARAFDGEDVSETLAAVLRSDPDWTRLPASLPPAVTALIKRCVERDVRKRIADFAVVRFVLDEAHTLAAAPQPVAAVDATPAQERMAEAVTRARQRMIWRVLIPSIAVAALAGSGLAIGAWTWAGASAPVVAPLITRFRLPLPEGQVLTLGRQMMVVSPDGRQVAYITQRQLLLHDFASFDAPVVLVAEENISAPAFSPDGTWLAFHSVADGAVKRVSVNGGAALHVCPAQTVASLSWDRSGILLGAGTDGVQRCRADGGRPEDLVKAAAGETILSPQMLPGDGAVLFTSASLAARGRERWDRAQIVLQSLADGSRRTIVSAGSDARITESGHLVYQYGGVLYAVAFDAASATLRGEPAPVVSGVYRGAMGGSQYSLSKGALAYLPGPASTTGGERQQLALADRSGVTTPLPVPANAFVHVRASRDGRRLAIGTDDGTQAIVWLYGLGGDGPMQRLSIDGNNRFPVWSPDGQWIAYQSERGGSSGIYRQRADGTGAAERLTTAGDGESHVPESWSPDGRHLAYSIARSSPSGVTYTLQMLVLSDLRSTPFGNVTSMEPIGAVFSPDGRWLAYTVAKAPLSAPDRGVFVQPFPPTGNVFQAPRQLVDFHPMWSADGRELIFLASTTARSMAAVRVTGTQSLSFGTPSRFPAAVVGDRLSAEPRAFDLLPDGRMIGAVTRLGGGFDGLTWEIRVVLNWFEELKAKVPPA